MEDTGATDADAADTDAADTPVAADETPDSEEAPESSSAPAAEPGPAKPASDEIQLGDIPEAHRLTRSQAELVFAERYLDRCVSKRHKAVFPLTHRRSLRDPVLVRDIDRALNKERRFPLTLSFALRPAFRHMGFTLFRAGDAHVFVTSVKPTPLAPGTAIPEIEEVEAHLREHPGSNRESLLAALRPGCAADSEEAAAVIGPLGWLVEKGHVIEFHDGTLSLPKG